MSKIPAGALGPHSPPRRGYDNGTGGGSPFGRDADSPGAGWAACGDAFCGDGCQHPAVPYLGDGGGESLYHAALSGGGSPFNFDGHSPLPKNDGEDAASPNSSAWSALPPPPPPSPRSQLRRKASLRIPDLRGDAPAPAFVEPNPAQPIFVPSRHSRFPSVRTSLTTRSARRRKPEPEPFETTFAAAPAPAPATVTSSWNCAWCQTSTTRQRRPGPRGPKTLCGKCHQRWKTLGETGPRSADWECDWCGVQETRRRFKGPKGPATLCASCGQSYGHGATGPPVEKDWRCNWCPQTHQGRQRPGPDGPKTLCDTCHTRWENGETGPRSDDWKCDQCGADDSQTRRFSGPNGPATACESCSQKWLRSKRRRRARRQETEETLICSRGCRTEFRGDDRVKARRHHERDCPGAVMLLPQPSVRIDLQAAQRRAERSALHYSEPETKKRPRKARVDDDVAAALVAALGADDVKRMRRAVEGIIPAPPELDRAAKDAIAAAAKETGPRDGKLKKDLKKALKNARATARRKVPPRDDDSDDDGPSPVDAILRGLVPNTAAQRRVITLRGALLKALKVEAADGNFMNITGAKGAALFRDGLWRYFEAASCNRGALSETSAVLLFATALVFAGRIERRPASYLASLVSVSGDPAPRALDAALKMIYPCDEVRDRLDSPAGVRAVEWLVNCVDARCQSADVACKVLADEGLNAFNHAEPMVLMQLLLDEKMPVYVKIVSFGRPACARCHRFFSLLGTVRASNDVPAALCPPGLSPNDITEKSGVIDIVAAAA